MMKWSLSTQEYIPLLFLFGFIVPSSQIMQANFTNSKENNIQRAWRADRELQFAPPFFWCVRVRGGEASQFDLAASSSHP